ncbi:hypothetical protein ABZ379_36620 [Streptomyces canus]|uniref:hypothetical protein n=1 Tax=Streptomyces canus TaxID=58343 RepID=UPI0033C673B8
MTASPVTGGGACRVGHLCARLAAADSILTADVLDRVHEIIAPGVTSACVGPARSAFAPNWPPRTPS